MSGLSIKIHVYYEIGKNMFYLLELSRVVEHSISKSKGLDA